MRLPFPLLTYLSQPEPAVWERGAPAAAAVEEYTSEEKVFKTTLNGNLIFSLAMPCNLKPDYLGCTTLHFSVLWQSEEGAKATECFHEGDFILSRHIMLNILQ